MPQRNFPYAYSELQRSLKEINTHFARVKVTPLPALAQMITLQTPKELETCVGYIYNALKAMPSGAPISEIQVTGLLCERFKDDAESFALDLKHEIEVHSMGLSSYLSGE